LRAAGELRAPTTNCARARTLSDGDDSSGSTPSIAPRSRAWARPSFWKQIDWIAPAAFACSSVFADPKYATSGGTPPASTRRATFSRS